MIRAVAAASAAVLTMWLPAHPAAAETKCVKIAVEKVNVRSAPNGACLGSLARGVKVNITNHPCSWCKIDRKTPSYAAKQFSYGGRILKSFADAKGCKKTPALTKCVKS